MISPFGRRQQIRSKNDVIPSNEDENAATVAVAQNENPSIRNHDDEEPSIPGAQKGGRKLAIVFTCTVCDTRSVKQFTENAYNNGVVIVQCPGCQSRHLIADNLGFFEDEEDGWNVEKALSRMGENVQVVTDDNVMELSVEDLYGAEKIQEAATATTSSASSNGKQ